MMKAALAFNFFVFVQMIISSGSMCYFGLQNTFIHILSVVLSLLFVDDSGLNKSSIASLSQLAC